MKALFLFMVSLVLIMVSCENPELTKDVKKGVLEAEAQFGLSKSFDSARIDVEKFTEQEVSDSTDWKVSYWAGVKLKEEAFKEQNIIKRKVLFHKSLEMILKSINLSPETIEQDIDFYDTVHAYDMLNILYGTNGLDNPLVQYLAIQIAVAMGGEIIDVLGIQVSDAYAKRYAELLALEGAVKPLANRDEEAAVTKLRWYLQGFLGYVRGEFDVALDEFVGLINEYPNYIILKEKINRLLAICREKIPTPVGEVTDIVPGLVYDFNKIKELVDRGTVLYSQEKKDDKEIEALAKQAGSIAVLKADADKNPDELFYHAQALLLLIKSHTQRERVVELILKAIAIGVSPVDYPLWDKVAGNAKLGNMFELYRRGIYRLRRTAVKDDAIVVSLFDMKQLMLPGSGEDRGQGYLFVWNADDYGQPKSDEFLNEGIQKISAEIDNPDSEYEYKILLYLRSQVFKVLGDKENSATDMNRFILLSSLL